MYRKIRFFSLSCFVLVMLLFAVQASTFPALAITPTPSPATTTGLKVQYKAGDTNTTDNQFKPYFTVINLGSVPISLSELKIRYYFTKDNAAGLQFNCDWAVVGCANVTGTFGALSPSTSTADTYLEVGFSTAAGSLNSGSSTGEIQTRNNHTDWTNFNESNDYSFDSTAINYQDAPKVALYRNGTLVWGTPPVTTITPTPITPTFQPITNTPTGIVGDMGCYTIAGTVKDSNGNPIAGATVSYSQVSYYGVRSCPTPSVTTTTTASNGSYLLGPAFIHDTDGFTFTVSAAGYVSQSITQGGIQTASAGPNFTLVRPTATPITPTATSPVKISGYVRVGSSTGSGLAGVTIKFAFASYTPQPVATTDANGYYSYQTDTVGHQETVTVVPEKAGYTFSPANYVYISPSFGSTTAIDFVGTSTPTITPTFTPTPVSDLTITGKVTNTSTGLPISGATVSATSCNPTPGWSTTTAADGTYSLGVHYLVNCSTFSFGVSATGYVTDTEQLSVAVVAANPVKNVALQSVATNTPTPTATITPSITNTFCPVSTQVPPPQVDPVTSPTNQMTQVVRVYASGSNVKITSEAGTFTTTSSAAPADITVNLLPNTTNHLTVSMTATGMSYNCQPFIYTVSTTKDKLGNALNIVQQGDTATAIPSTLKLQYRTGDTNATDNQIKPYFTIVNTGSAAVDMKTLKIRYYFTRDTAQNLSFWCDWSVVGCSNVSGAFTAISPAKTNADYYVEVSFTGGTIAANGNSGEIQTRLSKADWSNFSESNDYSYDATKLNYADWTKVTLYQSGTLVWGVEP